MPFEGILEERYESFEDQLMAKPRRFHKAFDFPRLASIAGHNLNQTYSRLHHFNRIANRGGGPRRQTRKVQGTGS
jgi:hypothetical protein